MRHISKNRVPEPPPPNRVSVLFVLSFLSVLAVFGAAAWLFFSTAQHLSIRTASASVRISTPVVTPVASEMQDTTTEQALASGSPSAEMDASSDTALNPEPKAKAKTELTNVEQEPAPEDKTAMKEEPSASASASAHTHDPNSVMPTPEEMPSVAPDLRLVEESIPATDPEEEVAKLAEEIAPAAGSPIPAPDLATTAPNIDAPEPVQAGQSVPDENTGLTPLQESSVSGKTNVSEEVASASTELETEGPVTALNSPDEFGEAGPTPATETTAQNSPENQSVTAVPAENLPEPPSIQITNEFALVHTDNDTTAVLPDPLTSPSPPSTSEEELTTKTAEEKLGPLPEDTPVETKPEKSVETALVAPAPKADEIAKEETQAQQSSLPWQEYAQTFSNPSGHPIIAIVIGEMGVSRAGSTSAIEQLPSAITLAFNPYSQDLPDWIEKARKHGHEILVQLPMEPKGYPNINPGPRALLTSLSLADNLERLNWILDRFEGYVGATNQMGSRFTASPEHIKPVLEVLKNRGLLYLDNRTASDSAGARIAEELRIPVALNNRFLDHQADGKMIDERLTELEQIAQRTGYAVGVAYPFPLSIQHLATWAKTLPEKNILLAPVSAIVNQQEVK